MAPADRRRSRGTAGGFVPDSPEYQEHRIEVADERPKAKAQAVARPGARRNGSSPKIAPVDCEAGAIEFRAVRDLRSNPDNARKHPEKQIEQLASSIQAFGFKTALTIDETGLVLAGNGRLEAARRLGLERVPCVLADGMSPEAKKAFAIGDNRIAQLSCWDDDILKIALDELSTKELDFAVEITGFDTVDLDRLLGPEPDPRGRATDAEGFSTDPDDRLPELAKEPAVARLSDVWVAGPHRILCGDALKAASYQVLLNSETASHVFTDPPYNVKNQGHVSKKAFREFPHAHGELSADGFTSFLARALIYSASVSADGAIFHVCMDFRHMVELAAAGQKARLNLKNLCIWAKPAAGLGTFYRSQYEMVFVFKHGTAPHINNFGLGARGRHRSNLWQYPSVRGVRTGVNDPQGGHPTVKPCAMVMDAIRDCSRRGDIVLDPFGGSGTTLIAAERVGRKARLIELDPHYVDLTLLRFQAVTGGVARLAGDGRSFDEIATARREKTS